MAESEGQQQQEGQEGQEGKPPEGQQEQQQAQAPEIPAEVKAALKKANKEAETFRLKLKEYEDRDKSEAEKTAERLKEAEARAEKAERASMRFTVAAKKGLPPELAARLHGDTEEEMAEDADALLKVLGSRRGTSNGSFDAGARGSSAGGSGSFLTQAIRERRRS